MFECILNVVCVLCDIVVKCVCVCDVMVFELVLYGVV